MKLLQDYLTDRIKLTEAQFLARHPAAVLIHRLRHSDALGLSNETQLGPRLSARPIAEDVVSMNVASTRALVHLTKVMSRLGGKPDPHPTEGMAVVFALPLSVGQPELSLGRGPEAAVVLPFPKISKVHARFALRAGEIAVCDAGSRNGTRVGGASLKAGEWRPLQSEVLVQLSEYSFLFYDSKGFYRLLGAE